MSNQKDYENEVASRLAQAMRDAGYAQAVREADKNMRGTGESAPFVVVAKPKQDEIEASMKAALTADVIDSLKSIDERDCSEEVYEKIQAAIKDLGG